MSCALCTLQGVAGPCPHRACPPDGVDPGGAVAEAVSPLADEWPHEPGCPVCGERRTLTGDEAAYELECIRITAEAVEIEHRWKG